MPKAGKSMPQPNLKTIKAMREARRGGLASFKSVKALLADLNTTKQPKQG